MNGFLLSGRIMSKCMRVCSAALYIRHLLVISRDCTVSSLVRKVVICILNKPQVVNVGLICNFSAFTS